MSNRIKTEEINGHNYYVFELGDLADRRERSLGRWRVARAMNEKKIYLGCPNCNSIIETNIGYVNGSGLLRAISCPECGNAFRSKLMLWDEFLKDLKGQ